MIDRYSDRSELVPFLLLKKVEHRQMLQDCLSLEVKQIAGEDLIVISIGNASRKINLRKENKNKQTLILEKEISFPFV